MGTWNKRDRQKSNFLRNYKRIKILSFLKDISGCSTTSTRVRTSEIYLNNLIPVLISFIFKIHKYLIVNTYFHIIAKQRS